MGVKQLVLSPAVVGACIAAYDEAVELLVAADPDGTGELDVRRLVAAPVAVRRRALLAAARAAGCPAGALSQRHAVALDALLRAGTGAADLPGGVRARLSARSPDPRSGTADSLLALVFAGRRSA